MSDSLTVIYVEPHQKKNSHENQSKFIFLMFSLVSGKFLGMRNIVLYSVFPMYSAQIQAVKTFLYFSLYITNASEVYQGRLDFITNIGGIQFF